MEENYLLWNTVKHHLNWKNSSSFFHSQRFQILNLFRNRVKNVYILNKVAKQSTFSCIKYNTLNFSKNLNFLKLL